MDWLDEAGRQAARGRIRQRFPSLECGPQASRSQTSKTPSFEAIINLSQSHPSDTHRITSFYPEEPRRGKTARVAQLIMHCVPWMPYQWYVLVIMMMTLLPMAPQGEPLTQCWDSTQNMRHAFLDFLTKELLITPKMLQHQTQTLVMRQRSAHHPCPLSASEGQVHRHVGFKIRDDYICYKIWQQRAHRSLACRAQNPRTQSPEPRTQSRLEGSDYNIESSRAQNRKLKAHSKELEAQSTELVASQQKV